MKITYYTHHPEESKSRRVVVGQNLVGIRLLSLEIDSDEELVQLLSEKGRTWAQKSLRFGLISRFMKPVDILQTEKETHWGSDCDMCKL